MPVWLFSKYKEKDNGLRFFFPRLSNLIKGTVKRRRSPTFLPARPLVCFCAHTWSSALIYLNALKSNLFLPHSKRLSATSLFFFVLFLFCFPQQTEQAKVSLVSQSESEVNFIVFNFTKLEKQGNLPKFVLLENGNYLTLPVCYIVSSIIALFLCCILSHFFFCRRSFLTFRVAAKRAALSSAFCWMLTRRVWHFLLLFCPEMSLHSPPSVFPDRLTGFQIPPPVTSTANVFSLRLTSDFAVSAHGFKLNYEGQRRVCVCLRLWQCRWGKRLKNMRGGKKITFSFDLNPGGKKETVLAHRGWRMLGEMKKVIQNSKKHPES